MQRRALIVGIDTYRNAPNLSGCVADAKAMTDLLSKHQDEAPNFECRTLVDQMEDGSPITRPQLRQACEDLFRDFRGNALLYFSGHGILTSTGGYLCTSDAEKNDWGVPMQDILQFAADAPANDVIVLLDCCHSGDFANPALLKGGSNPLTVLRENMTVIAASLPNQLSVEAGGHGLFTAAVMDALQGGAADHMGWVTPASIYAYVERRFGAWDQRPVYKSHTSTVTVVRECAPLIERSKLRRLIELFSERTSKYPLDPEFEPEDEHGNVHGPVNQDKVELAHLFKEYRDAGLLKPSEPREQLYWTARKSHTVQLTDRGQEYWWLAKNNKI
jgi:hypothetical protein